MAEKQNNMETALVFFTRKFRGKVVYSSRCVCASDTSGDRDRTEYRKLAYSFFVSYSTSRTRTMYSSLLYRDTKQSLDCFFVVNDAGVFRGIVDHTH